MNDSKMQGEIIGGSVREDDYDKLKEKMKTRGLLSGLGLERFIELCTGVSNIRDTIPVPRVPGSCLL